MALMKLGEYERNGYHDSDGYYSVWDTETQEVASVLAWTTRFAGGPSLDLTPLTEGALEQARLWLEEQLYLRFKHTDEMAVMEPNDVAEDERVSLTEAHRNREREEVSEDCRKCFGEGKWINPRNSADIRDCFGCHGSGQRTKNKAKKGGKMISFKAGTSGTVISVNVYGTFYANGYNQPGRHNRQVLVALDDGGMLRAPLAKLRKDKPLRSEEELREIARKRSYGYEFNSAVGMTAWSTTNEAQALAKKLGTLDAPPVSV